MKDNEKKISRKQADYIEKVGKFYEKHGLPRMAGRILGCLLCLKSDQSFDTLREILEASKGSISQNIRLLLNQNFIEKYSIPNDRKSYYRLGLNSLENIIEAKAQSITDFKLVLTQGLNLNESESTSQTKNIKKILSYYEFLEEEMPKLRVKWENQQKNKS